MNVFEKLTQQWLGLENEELADVVDLADPRPTRTIVRDNFEHILENPNDREQTIATLLDQLVYAEEDEKDEIMMLLKILGYPGKEASVKTAQLQLLNEPPQSVVYSVGIIWFYDGREYYWDYRDPDAMHGHAFAALNGDEMPDGAYNADVYRGEKVDEDEIIYGNYWTGPLEVDLNAPGIALEDWVVQKAFDKFPDALNMRYFDGMRTERIFLRMYPHEYDSFLNNKGYRPEVPIHFQQKAEKEIADPSATLGNDLNPEDYQAILDANKGENLEGLPGEVNVPNLGKLTFHSNADIQAIEENYREGMSWTDIGEKPRDYVKVDPDISAQIAQAYEEMEHDPLNPDVQTIYSHFKEETMWQYDDIVSAGYVFEFYPDYDPYPNSPREAVLDLHNNKHMYVYPTETGFGAGEDVTDHPMLEETYVRWNDRPVTYNDIFRAVHDFFGHAKEGVGFRADGEDNAYRQHASMYSSEARKALFNETRGQNAWVNYGPHGEHNRTATADETVFAPQKAGMPPDWAVDPDIHKSGWYREAGSADTQNFFSDAMSAQHAPNQPLQPDHVSQDPRHQEIYHNMQGYYGPFDEHIETSIPDFRSNSLRKIDALLNMGGGTFLDIAGGTGSLAKSLTDMSGGAWQTVNLEPNGEMINHFNQTPLDNAQIIPEAFGESFEMDGQVIPQHQPSQQYDVVHESMGFQFIDSNREPMVAEAKNLLKPDGLFLTEEKFHTENEMENEQIKDEWKSNYYNTQQLQRKNEEVGFQGQGPMTDNLWQDSEYEMLLRSYFAYVEEYWQSGNFKGYACSDSPEKVAAFIGGLGQMEVTAAIQSEYFPGALKFVIDFTDGQAYFWDGLEPHAQILNNIGVQGTGRSVDVDTAVAGYIDEYGERVYVYGDEAALPNVNNIVSLFPPGYQMLFNNEMLKTADNIVSGNPFGEKCKFMSFYGEDWFWAPDDHEEYDYPTYEFDLEAESHGNFVDEVLKERGLNWEERQVAIDELDDDPTALFGWWMDGIIQFSSHWDYDESPLTQQAVKDFIVRGWNPKTIFQVPPATWNGEGIHTEKLFETEDNMTITAEVIQDVDVSDLSPTVLPGINKFVLDLPSGNGYFWPYQDYRYHHPFVIRGLGYDQEGEGLSPDYDAPVVMGYYNNGGQEKTVFPLHSVECAVTSPEPTEEEIDLIMNHFPEAVFINWNGKGVKLAATVNEEGYIGFEGEDIGNKHKFILTPDGEFYAWGKKSFDYGKGFLAIENEGTLYDELDDFTKFEWNMDASDTYQFYRQNGYATGQTSSGSFFMINAPSGLNVSQIEALENLFREQGYRNIIIHEAGKKMHFNNGKEALDYLSPRRNEEPEEKDYSGFFEGTPEYQASWKQSSSTHDMFLIFPQGEVFTHPRYDENGLVTHTDLAEKYNFWGDKYQQDPENWNYNNAVRGWIDEDDNEIAFFPMEEMEEFIDDWHLTDAQRSVIAEMISQNPDKEVVAEFPNDSIDTQWKQGIAEEDIPFGYSTKIHSPDKVHKFIVDEYVPVFWVAPFGMPSYPLHGMAADELGLGEKFDLQAYGYYWPPTESDMYGYPRQYGAFAEPVVTIHSVDDMDWKIIDVVKQATGAPNIFFNDELVEGQTKQAMEQIDPDEGYMHYKFLMVNGEIFDLWPGSHADHVDAVMDYYGVDEEELDEMEIRDHIIAGDIKNRRGTYLLSADTLQGNEEISQEQLQKVKALIPSDNVIWEGRTLG